LLLAGDGEGGFVSVPGSASGLGVYGDGRGSAVADYDRDGRWDLVVGQNGAATRLFRNLTAPPALRVRLAGPPANPDGVGALVRPGVAAESGPVFEVRSGSGYLSLSAPEVLLPRALVSGQVHVRWPTRDAAWLTYDLPSDAAEVRLSPDGSSEVTERVR
jgi:hypothetical protein